ncbi:hypothetical protein CB1_000083008 [Camelus ferus]|nr:hypothetical protein CB1_000083008 [Camelus ferus]
MGSHVRARRAAVALGFAGLLCAVLGAVMIVMVPSIIKQQVLKVATLRVALTVLQSLLSQFCARPSIGSSRKPRGRVLEGILGPQPDCIWPRLAVEGKTIELACGHRWRGSLPGVGGAAGSQVCPDSVVFLFSFPARDF